MTKGEEGHHRLVEALVWGSQQRERENLDSLCKRLGIARDKPTEAKWLLIGMKLAKEQPEFTGLPRRKGRPSSSPFEKTDIKRAVKMQEFKRLVESLVGTRVSVAELIRTINDPESEFQKEFPKSLLSGEPASLQNSISRGRAALKKMSSRKRTRK